MLELIIRFLVGGVVVSGFALAGEVVGPKSLAGVFGAAPSIAIATLGLTIETEGKLVAAHESQAMIVGAAAFFFYAWCCFALLAKRHWRAKLAGIGSLVVWLGAALGLWWAILR
jgi:Protein of unknown function (DUF3147)